MSNVDKHFKKQREDTLFTAYLQNSTNQRNDTYLETREGVDDTPLIAGRVPFKKLLKDQFREKIINELRERGISPTEEELKNFTKLKNRLKESKGNRKDFLPRLGFDYFRWW